MPLIQFTKDEPKPQGNGTWKKGQRLQVTNQRRDELVKAGKAKEVRRVRAGYKEPEPNFKERPDLEPKESSKKKKSKKESKTKN